MRDMPSTRPPSGSARMRLIRIVITVALVGFILYVTDWSALVATIRNLSVPAVGTVLAINIAAHIFLVAVSKGRHEYSRLPPDVSARPTPRKHPRPDGLSRCKRGIVVASRFLRLLRSTTAV